MMDVQLLLQALHYRAFLYDIRSPLQSSGPGNGCMAPQECPSVKPPGQSYASVQQPKRLGGQVHASNVKTQECLKGSWDLVTRVIRRVANYTSNNL